MGQTLVLASASPRRHELLGRLGLTFEVLPADVDEAIRPGEPARPYVERIAQEKAQAVAQLRPGALVLAADTTVVLDERILAKPGSAEAARQMLAALSGRVHQVLTAVCLAGAAQASAVVSTEVRFRPLSSPEIAWYVQTGEPLDKAGAYALQGAGGFLVQAISGSHSNVIGLPLGETVALLEQVGYPLPWSAR
jgi:septum formation protein